MSNIAIRVENLGKQYRIGALQKRHDTLRDMLASAFSRSNVPTFKRSNDDLFWALRDVSFEIKRGEVVGVIGRNGAGKSTLLKILSRITEPTTGAVDMYGRVGSLLEVGTGFHAELSGRENIYLSGAIMGMRKAEIDRKFDEIVAFAEVEKFIDTPVKHYSSGMYVRLAFAVAAHLEPEILLVDEVLAVGDVAFQKKCLGKMGDVAKEGRTVLFVSHNMASVALLCKRGVFLENGQLQLISNINTVVTTYLSKMKESNPAGNLLNLKNSSGNGEVEVLSVELTNSVGNSFAVSWDEPIRLIIAIRATKKISHVSLGIGMCSLEGLSLFTVRSSDDADGEWNLEENKCYRFEATIYHNLRAGYYQLLLGIATGNYVYYYNSAVAQLEILDIGKRAYPYKNNGIINCTSTWKVN